MPTLRERRSSPTIGLRRCWPSSRTKRSAWSPRCWTRNWMASRTWRPTEASLPRGAAQAPPHSGGPVMKKILWSELTVRGILLAIAFIAPTLFPASQLAYSTLHHLALLAIIPAAIVLGIAWAALRRSRFTEFAASIRNGAIAGAVATIALEVVRYSGFRVGFMPGNLP